MTVLSGTPCSGNSGKFAAVRRASFLLAVLFLFAASCGKQETAPLNAGRTVTGPAGETLALPASLRRIISTAPSNTEFIVDLGSGDAIIAADKYSLDILDRAELTEKAQKNRKIAVIDFAWPDAEAILALKPDLIIASELNRVAGNDPFKVLRDMGIAVAYIPTSKSIADIYRDIAFLSEILGVSERGRALISAMQESIESAAAVGRRIQKRKTVYFEISPPPHIVSFGSGTFLHEMLEIIGADNIFAGTPGWIAPGAEAIAAANPDVILTNAVLPGGADPREELASRPGFGGIRAVQNGAIYRIDADASSRPTHHIGTALYEMARSVYPEHYK